VPPWSLSFGCPSEKDLGTDVWRVNLITHPPNGPFVDFIQTTATGAIAGLTIFISLPVARVSGVTKGVRGLMSGGASGVLLFLFLDVTYNGFQPVITTWTSTGHQMGATLVPVLVFALGFGLAFLGLSFYMSSVKSENVTSPFRLSLLIAAGIGMHNFGEGLAIGASAEAGLISLAILLVVGFALHNSTEGFGIVAPLVSVSPKPTWSFLAKLGVVGGFPTILGSMVGFFVLNLTMYILFMSAAAGAILFVVIQLYRSIRRMGMIPQFASGAVVGFIVAYLADILVSQFI
jgi:ZIP family zinc transporter